MTKDKSDGKETKQESEIGIGISDSLSQREKAELGKKSTEYLIQRFKYATHPDARDIHNPYLNHVEKNRKRVPEYVGKRAYKRNKELQDTITSDEAIAIAHYTGEGFNEINGLFDRSGKLREDANNNHNKEAYAVAVTLDSALKKLEEHKKDKEPETSYRYHKPHSKPDLESLKQKEDYTSKGFLSSTSHRGNKKVKQEFLFGERTPEYNDRYALKQAEFTHTPVKFAITSTSGISVEEFSHKPGEGEILFRPGVQFEVGNVEPVQRGDIIRGGRHERLNIQLKEKERERETSQNISTPPKPLSDFRKVDKKPGGTVPGYLAEDGATGDRYIIKKVQSDEHARNEVLASKLYEALGVEVPELSLYQSRNRKGQKRLYVASKVIDGLESKDLQYQTHKDSGLYEGFVADAFLANWDTVGLEYDNIKFKGGKAVRLDLGGSLEYRAQGEPKGGAFSTNVRETSSLLKQNRQYASVFTDSRLDKKALETGFEKLESLTEDKLYDIVQQHGPKTQEDKKEMFLKLANRKDDLLQQKNKLLGIEESQDKQPDRKESTKWQDSEAKRELERQNSVDSGYFGLWG